MNAGLVMIRCMTHRARHAVLAIICAMPMVLTSSAQAADDEEVPNARLMGYQESVNVGGGQAGSYVVLGFLGVLTCGILFKNANRSHLD
jgi:hypothetical protein